MKDVIANAKKALVDVLKSRAGEPHLVTSGTYGNDDPFTLTWLTELAFRWGEQRIVAPEELAAFKEFKERIVSVVNQVLSREQDILDTKDIGFSEVTSSFLKLRRLHLARAAKRLEGNDSSVGKWIEKNKPDFWKDFDDTIHRQLSYSSMRDAKFDPAELAMAFEGALLLHPTWIGRYTIDEVFEALKLSRDRHPYWRPITPFLANDQGHVLFLISIEVANSILRACEILDESDASLTQFSKIESQLRAYAVWLLGEVEEIADTDPEKPNLVGWRTEYEDKRDTIQLWHTSHVLVFLAHYASLLKRKIAADGIEAAGLQVRAPKVGAPKVSGPKLDDVYWSDEPLRDLATKGQKYAVLATINSQYIKSRGNPKEALRAPRSMLLYGPPGTGKTTVAEKMAASLNRPLIIITVSDFLAAGAAEIENRAKGVFEVLRSQEDVIVLFDEIDQFVLDRNSKLYSDQDDIFKFMTPGMLTKLQDLRDAEGCIFIIATNYYERIDSAIKRRGRIDQQFLLCIPDQFQRRKLIERFVLDRFAEMLTNEVTFKEYEAKAGNGGPSAQFFQDISMSRGPEAEKKFEKIDFKTAAIDKKVLEKTALFGYGDLKNLVELKTEFRAGMDVNSLAEAIADAASPGDSAVTLSAYGNRFNEDNSPPFEEFFLLLYLVAESGRQFNNQELQTIHHVLDCIDDFEPEHFERLKEEYIDQDAIYEKLCERKDEILAQWKKKSR